MTRRTMSCAALAALLAAGVCVAGSSAVSADPPKSIDVYPLDACVVTGAKLGTMGAPVVKSIAGREFRFCCPGCVAKVEAAPEAYVKILDEAVIAQQRPTYPLDTCIVMEKKLNPDSTIEIVRGGRLFRLCCADCSKEVAADPAKFRAQLDETAAEKQRPAYPLTTCVVSGKALGDKPTAVVASGRLVLFCSGDCVKAFEKSPAKYLGLLDEAARAKGLKTSSTPPAPAASSTAGGHQHGAGGAKAEGTDPARNATAGGCGGGCCK